MKAKPVRRLKEQRVTYATKSCAPRQVLFPQARYLTRKERVALKAYKDYLLEKLPDQIERIVLFGSKARGDSTRHSDVDLLVVVKDKPVTNWGLLEPRWFAVVDPTFDFLMNYGVYLSPTVMCLDETKQWTPLLAHVREEGVELWRRRKKNRLN
jgi:hypothetical protein